MENMKELNLTPLSIEDTESINGGIIPAIIAGVYATKAICAMYGTAKVAGAVTGAAAYAYVNS